MKNINLEPLSKDTLDLFKMLTPKGGDPLEGLVDDMKFSEIALHMNVVQLIQVVGLQVHVSKFASFILAHEYCSLN